MMHTKKQRITIGNKLSLYILVISMICFIILGFLSYISVGYIMTDQCKKEGMIFAEFAAGEIDGDLFETVTSNESEGFDRIHETLDKYKASELITYIYTMRLDENGVLRFVVDADPVDPCDCGEEYELLEDMKPAFKGEVSCDKNSTTDEWGTYYSAYAPIYSSDRRIVGIVGCDIGLDNVNSIKRTLLNVIIILLSFFFAVCFIIYSTLSRRVVTKDFLTDLSNYDGLIEKGTKLSRKGKLSDYTAFLINIKDFKYLNQKTGANSGDMVLREYALQLKKNIGSREFIARTASDNFLALILNSNAEKFKNNLSEIRLPIVVDKKEEITLILSRAGIYRIKDNDSIKEAMNFASVALKEARRKESDDHIEFKDDMLSVMVEEKKLLSECKKALKNGEFTAYYQPKVDLNDNSLCGAEALVRWIKGDEIISPWKFIPLLEKENKIAELDFYIFETVCKNICEWQNKGLTPCRISSNFSKVHLADDNFADKVLEIVRKYNVDHKYIEIELTESSSYSDMNALNRFVAEMNKESIHISIDDFGTGYSSLSMLKDINADVVKIDKSFLNKSCSDDSLQEKMLESVIHMINNLEKDVICEGVETKEQLDFLRNAGCGMIQGYYFDKPLPKEEFEKRLRDPIYKIS